MKWVARFGERLVAGKLLASFWRCNKLLSRVLVPVLMMGCTCLSWGNGGALRV